MRIRSESEKPNRSPIIISGEAKFRESVAIKESQGNKSPEDLSDVSHRNVAVSVLDSSPSPIHGGQSLMDSEGSKGE